MQRVRGNRTIVDATKTLDALRATRAARLSHQKRPRAQACDTVVYLDRSWLKLTPGLHIVNNESVTVPLTEKRVDEILNGGQKRNGLYRVAASQWLEGRTIGPFHYEGKRSDDPNDIIEHDDRRDLRGARLFAAWLGHTDSREQNTMVTWNP